TWLRDATRVTVIVPRVADPAWRRPLLVGIAGGSGSVKTTIGDAVAESLREVVLLQHDAYYRDRTDLDFAERSRLNYDRPDSLETELLIEHLELLVRGVPIARPMYNFSVSLRA